MRSWQYTKDAPSYSARRPSPDTPRPKRKASAFYQDAPGRAGGFDPPRAPSPGGCAIRPASLPSPSSARRPLIRYAPPRARKASAFYHGIPAEPEALALQEPPPGGCAKPPCISSTSVLCTAAASSDTPCQERAKRPFVPLQSLRNRPPPGGPVRFYARLPHPRGAGGLNPLSSALAASAACGRLSLHLFHLRPLHGGLHPIRPAKGAQSGRFLSGCTRQSRRPAKNPSPGGCAIRPASLPSPSSARRPSPDTPRPTRKAPKRKRAQSPPCAAGIGRTSL